MNVFEFKKTPPGEQQQFISEHRRLLDEALAFIKENVERAIQQKDLRKIALYREELAQLRLFASALVDEDSRFEEARSRIVKLQVWILSQLTDEPGSSFAE